MMNRTLRRWMLAGTASLVFLGAVACAGAADQINAPSDAWVRLYDDKSFKDNVLTVRFPEDHRDLHALKWDSGERHPGDRISSVKWQIPKGWAIVLFDDKGFKDSFVTLVGTGKVRELSDLGSFNDKCSSVRWERVPE